MKLRPRLALAAFALVLAPLAASAQEIELITEAPVTFQLTFGTSVTTTNGLSGAARVDTTRSYNSVIGNAEILDSLKLDGLITDTTTANWRLVALRSAPSDVVYVNTEFLLYAIKVVNNVVTNRVLVPADKFSALTNALYSGQNYVEIHQGQNVISSRGTVTNYGVVSLTPRFTRKEVPPVITGPTGGFRFASRTETAFVLDDLISTGFSTIAYASRTIEPVFFCAIDSLRYTSRGDFRGQLTNTVTNTRTSTVRGSVEESPPLSVVTDPTPTPAQGLVSISLTVGASKLVDRALYPAVPFEDTYGSL
jgi:hypothetical protein